jgi:hypothetical protein
VGNGRRLRNQCTLDEDFVECLELDYRECLLIGTPQEVVMRALKRLPKYISGTEKEWQQKKKQIRKNLRKMSAKDAERDGGGRWEDLIFDFGASRDTKMRRETRY